MRLHKVMKMPNDRQSALRESESVRGGLASVRGVRSVRRCEYGAAALPVLACVVGAFGVLMVYSASRYAAQTQLGDPFFYMKKQLIGLLLGAAAMLACGFFPYKRLKKLKWAALAVSFVLLAAVFIPGIGVENYGATRWIGIGGVTIQPSEIAKFGFILFTAAYVDENPERMKSFKGILPVLCAGGGICVLVILEPNMSVTMVIGSLMLTMLFLGGVQWKYFLVLAIPALIAVPLLIVAEPYRLQRLYAFLDPWSSPQGEGYQLIQSLYALGNGGWLGTGLFRSMQKYRYLPFAESDFILAVIGEELGLVGVILLFCVFGAIVFFGIRTASRCKDTFGFMLSSGITAVFAIQIVINALVVSGAIPPTGLPLPLVSAGNTSLIMTMAAIGVLWNISRGGERVAEVSNSSN